MSDLLEREDVERFGALVREWLGFNVDDARLEALSEVLARRLDAVRKPAGVYLQALEHGRDPAELRALACELTVTETYFFRNRDQFRALSEIVLPERMATRAPIRTLRLFSAGCASGEEPYSLAIIVQERVPDPSWDVSIRAADVSPMMLERAARASYSPWALRETPPEVRDRWFKRAGRDYVLDSTIRKRVSFCERNLAADDCDLGPSESCDVIFCRNVIMYFTPERAQAVVDRLTRLLAPGGYLFLGHAETLRGLSNEYHLRHTHGTFYYQRRDAPPTRTLELDGSSIGHGEGPAAPPANPFALEDLTAQSWIDTIQRSSERISRLAERPLAGASGGAGPSVATRRAVELDLALDLMHRERFSEALDLLAAAPEGAARDPELLLVRAALLTHAGRLEAAEAACSELLQLDELSTGAHYLLALCREGAGDRPGAIDHDQIAVYLDPGFAMPRLHLGLMARRAGDRDTARRELEHASALLPREDASRLLLFGGGFGRDALIALCRAELVAAGGRP